MSKKALDLGQTGVCTLFFEYFFPTLLSMTFSAILNVADGAFVGRGVGSDALAAVNVAAPVFMFATGMGLMLGSGASVAGAVRMSQGDNAKAGALASEAILTTLAFGALVAAAVLLFPRQLCRVFGGSEALLPYVADYLRWISLGMLCFGTMVASMFIIRLDGSPRYAMMTNVVPSLLNIGLDYLFVFPLDWGIAGAAWATSISGAVGVLLAAVYFIFFSKNFRISPPRLGIRQALTDVLGMCKIGAPALIGEFAISFMLIVGNYMFIGALGEDGVAAFSVACYLTPMIFMFANSIAQSSMPIVSYNYGSGREGRVATTMRLSVAVAIGSGLAIGAILHFCADNMAAIFLDTHTRAYALASRGLPLFALGFPFLTINIVLISFLQSVERSRAASVFMTLRGFVFIFAFSQCLPPLMGESGLWLTICASEVATLLVILASGRLRKG
ncbi:MAG: MATE family efflux transporter [Bacteroidales bacterium]|nr:MATE family efflux transporter [Bacteroidales bacterium]